MRLDLKRQARKILRGEGDAIEGEKIIAQARNIGKPYVVAGTATHQIQQIALRSNVICIVDKAFHLKGAALRRTTPKRYVQRG
jgi:diphthamide synthase subunit DPH2